MTNYYLLSSLEAGAVIVERIVGRIDDAKYDVRTDPERFSFREAVAHISDWEPILFGRLKAALDNPGSTVQGIDEGQRALDMSYAKTDPLAEARRFAELRRETVQWLRDRTADEWRLEVTHTEKGRMSLFDQAVTLLGHDTYHIEHLTQYL
jgi:hypothetical protein